MNNIPLHPMVVHFPIVLALLLPICAVGALWLIRRGAAPALTWSMPVLLAAGLAVSTFVAVRTGEAEEDVVEKVVPENVLHAHEEAAEQLLVLALAFMGMALAGLSRRRVGRAARAVAAVFSLVLVLAAVRVGKAGGELVYVHHAASAYPSQGAP